MLDLCTNEGKFVTVLSKTILSACTFFFQHRNYVKLLFCGGVVTNEFTRVELGLVGKDAFPRVMFFSGCAVDTSWTKISLQLRSE